MRQPPEVRVIAINKDYGYTMIELEATNAQPMSFVVHWDSIAREYVFSQTGENNTWRAYPDERK